MTLLHVDQVETIKNDARHHTAYDGLVNERENT